MDIYCARCKKKTPTKNLKIENISITSKSGKISNRRLAKGTCSVCSTSKQQFVENDGGSKGSSKGSGYQGEGQSYLVDKKDLSKKTFNALKEIVETNSVGKLTIRGKVFEITPENLKVLKKAHNNNLLNKVAKAVSGEKTKEEIINKESKKGGIAFWPEFVNFIKKFI